MPRSQASPGPVADRYELEEALKTLEPPGLDMPMQQVPFVAAVWAARQLRCRLPTEAEWQAALAAHEPVQQLQQQQQRRQRPWNRRDRTWAVQQASVSERLGRDDLFWADRGVFNPPAAPHGAQATVDLRSNDAYADGILWFRPVTSAPNDGDEDDDNDDNDDNDDHACRGLGGNVAEFLCDSPVPPDGDVTRRAPFTARRRRGRVGPLPARTGLRPCIAAQRRRAAPRVRRRRVPPRVRRAHTVPGRPDPLRNSLAGFHVSNWRRTRRRACA